MSEQSDTSVPHPASGRDGWHGWARRLHRQGVANARAAATETSRRRLEAVEVDAYLEGLGHGDVQRSVETARSL